MRQPFWKRRWENAWDDVLAEIPEDSAAALVREGDAL